MIAELFAEPWVQGSLGVGSAAVAIAVRNVYRRCGSRPLDGCPAAGLANDANRGRGARLDGRCDLLMFQECPSCQVPGFPFLGPPVDGFDRWKYERICQACGAAWLELGLANGPWIREVRARRKAAEDREIERRAEDRLRRAEVRMAYGSTMRPAPVFDGFRGTLDELQGDMEGVMRALRSSRSQRDDAIRSGTIHLNRGGHITVEAGRVTMGTRTLTLSAVYRGREYSIKERVDR